MVFTDKGDRIQILNLYKPDGSKVDNTDDLPLSRSIDNGENVENYEILLKTDSKTKYLSANSTPVRDDKNNVIGAIEVWQDLTEHKKYINEIQKRTGELAAANKDLESFSYSVAHDLKSPLATIKEFCNFINEDCGKLLKDECKDNLRIIQDSAVKMNSIIDDILALSKISRQEIEISEVDLSKIVQSNIEALCRSEPDRTVDVSIQKEVKVLGDERLLNLILGNLVGNAWKYTSKIDKPKIEFGSFFKNKQRVYFVKDNGAGFDMKKAGDLFTPFKRLHKDKEFKGTGVGLAIVERAVSRHGGKVWAESEEGKGATFYFTLGGQGNI